MTKDTMPSFDEMLDALDRNPLKAIQLAGKAHRGVNRRSYEVAAIVVGFARILTDKKEHREDFYDEEFFDELERFHPSKLLLHCFAYVNGALDGPDYNRSSERSWALENVCADRSIDVADIPQYIADHGGFDGLLSERDEMRAQEDDQKTDAGVSSPGGRGSRPGVAKSPTNPDPTLTANDDGPDEDLIDEASTGEGLNRPKRKAPKSEATEPQLALLSREMIAAYVLVRPRAPLTMGDIWQALKNGKKVTGDFAMGETSTTHELYTGGGPFIDVYLEEIATD